MPVTKQLVTPLAKFRRASKLCSKAIGIVKLLSKKVRKRHGHRALGFAQKFRKFRKSQAKPFRRSLSCPLPVEARPECPPDAPERTELVLDCVEHCFPERREPCVTTHSVNTQTKPRSEHSTQACSPSPPERTVLVLDCVEHSFPERRQSCTRHGLMHALADHDPSCEDSGYDDSSVSEEEPELDCSPPRPPNSRLQNTSALAHHLRREILTTEEAIKRNAGHIDFVRNYESERGINYPWTNCFSIGSKILAKNKRLLAEILLILTAALKDIPVKSPT